MTTCIICLQDDGVKIQKNKEFGCNCPLYFHQECWNLFCANGNLQCPLCRKKIKYSPPIFIRIFTITLYISLSSCFILYITSALLLSPEVENYHNIMHICIGFPSLWIFAFFCTSLELGYRCLKYIQIICNIYSLVLFVLVQIYMYEGWFNDHVLILTTSIINVITYYCSSIFFICVKRQ